MYISLWFINPYTYCYLTNHVSLYIVSLQVSNVIFAKVITAPLLRSHIAQQLDRVFHDESYSNVDELVVPHGFPMVLEPPGEIITLEIGIPWGLEWGEQHQKVLTV